MLKWIAPLAAMIVSGCGSSNDDAPTQAELSTYVEVQTKQAVRARLKDPDSAVFDDFRMPPKAHRLLVAR